MRKAVGAASIWNVVITRSKKGNKELAVRLKHAGFNPILVNTISLLPPKDWSTVDGFLHNLSSFDWLVFTSATGVEYFGERMKSLSLKLPWRGRPFVAAVGERTASKLSELRIKPRFIPSSYLTEKLAEELPADNGNRVLLLRADIADPKLAERLREREYDVAEAAIYNTQIIKDRSDKGLQNADFIVFASPSAVRGFCGTVPKDEMAKLQRIKAICIGPVTEATAKENGFTKTITPKSYTLDAVVDEIERLSQRNA